MRILYDGHVYGLRSVGGVVRYYSQLIRLLPSNWTPIVSAPNVPVIHGPAHPQLVWKIAPQNRFSWFGRQARQQTFFRELYPQLPCDLLHPTYYELLSGGIESRPKVPMVITVYDMIHERFASLADRHGADAARKRKAIEAATAIICISENTKHDLLEFYPQVADRVSVIHLASQLGTNEVKEQGRAGTATGRQPGSTALPPATHTNLAGQAHANRQGASYQGEGTPRANPVRTVHGAAGGPSSTGQANPLLPSPVTQRTLVSQMNPLSQEASQPVVASPTGQPYFLFVGGRGGYKNFDRLLFAWKAVVGRISDCHLAVVGDLFRSKERRRIADLGLGRHVREYGCVGDEQLRKLYQNAVALVYPSLYEGFGIPLLEAMECGTVVVASQASSIPEVVDDAALLFDPTKQDDLTDILLDLLTRPESRAQWIDRGRRRAALFSWRQTTGATMNVYRALQAGGPVAGHDHLVPRFGWRSQRSSVA